MVIEFQLELLYGLPDDKNNCTNKLILQLLFLFHKPNCFSIEMNIMLTTVLHQFMLILVTSYLDYHAEDSASSIFKDGKNLLPTSIHM